MSGNAPPVKTHLVCGFLGAGKTTFILEQLQKTGPRVAVLINEFGELGIDGELVRTRSGIEVVELPGGCICCSQKEGLEASIRRIAEEIRPELLLIEPSGIAEASAILTVLAKGSAAGLISLGAVIAIVDAETLLEYAEPEAFGAFFLDQLENADIVIINKIDLVGEDRLGEIEQRIGAINPGALVLKTAHGRMDQVLPEERVKEEVVVRGSRLPFACLSLLPTEDPPADRLTRFLDRAAAGDFGRVLRTKGFVRTADRGWLTVQGAGGRVALEEMAEPAVEPRLTLIGFDLDEGAIRAFFAERAE